MNLPAVQAIDHPRTSLGSTRETPRARIHIHMEPGKLTPIHLEALLKWQQTALKDFAAIIGTLSTMASPTAMLLDCMANTTGHVHGHLSWSSLVISPRLVLVETRTDSSTWNADLAAAWNHNPTTSGIKVRFRPSARTRQPFAQVEATAANIAAVRARKGQTQSSPTIRNPPTLQATISLPLATCGQLDQWLPTFMQKVSTANNIPLQMTSSETGLDIHHWKAIMAFDGSWTGKVLVQLATAQEVHQLHASIHGKGIEVHHHLAAIAVDSNHLDLSSRAAPSTAQQS